MDAVVSDQLKELVEHWVRLAAETDGRPGCDALDPAALPKLLKQILLIDVLHDPLSFRHRLVGTGITETVGRDSTGHSVDHKLYNQTAGSIFEAYAAVVREKHPMHANGKVQFSASHSLDAEVVLLPLFEAERVQIIVAGLELSGEPATASGEPRPNRPFEIYTDGPRSMRL